MVHNVLTKKLVMLAIAPEVLKVSSVIRRLICANTRNVITVESVSQ